MRRRKSVRKDKYTRVGYSYFPVSDSTVFEEALISLKKLKEFTQAVIDPGEIVCAVRIETRNSEVKPVYFNAWNLRTLESHSTYHDLTRKLDEIMDLLMECHVVLIEDQCMPNNSMVKLQQHMLTFLMLRLAEAPLKPLLVVCSSVHRYSILGITGSGKKLQSHPIADRLLAAREDTFSQEVISSNKRVTDLKDVVLIGEVFATEHIKRKPDVRLE